jgi:hypothetical protein
VWIRDDIAGFDLRPPAVFNSENSDSFAAGLALFGRETSNVRKFRLHATHIHTRIVLSASIERPSYGHE